MIDMARPVGRPRTTGEDLPQDWKQIIMDCGQEGGTTGTLFSVKAATEGNRALVDGDTLDVTISLTVSSA